MKFPNKIEDFGIVVDISQIQGRTEKSSMSLGFVSFDFIFIEKYARKWTIDFICKFY